MSVGDAVHEAVGLVAVGIAVVGLVVDVAVGDAVGAVVGVADASVVCVVGRAW